MGDSTAVTGSGGGGTYSADSEEGNDSNVKSDNHVDGGAQAGASSGNGQGQQNRALSTTDADGDASMRRHRLPAGKVTGVDVAIMVLAISIETEVAITKSGNLKITIKENELHEINNETLDKIAQAVEAMSKARKSGEMGRVFGWVAAAAAVVVATVTLNPALMAVALMSIGMMIAQETGGMEDLAEMIGQDAFIAVMVIIAIVMVVAPMAAPTAIGGAATSAAAASARGATASSQISHNASTVRVAAQAIEGGSTVASGAYTYDNAKYEAESARDRAKADKLSARSQVISDHIQDMIDWIIELLEKTEENKRVTVQILADVHQTNVTVTSSTA